MQKQHLQVQDIRVIKDKRALNGTNYIEIYPGDFKDGVQYWNDNSYYMDFEVFNLFLKEFKEINRNFNIYSTNIFLDDELILLNKQFTVNLKNLNNIDDIESFKNQHSKWIFVNSSNFGVKWRDYLVALKKLNMELRILTEKTIKNNSALWVLGI